MFNGESMNYGKITVFISVIILRILLEGEGGSIKCGHLDEGVLVVLFFRSVTTETEDPWRTNRDHVVVKTARPILLPASFPQ